MRLNAVGRKVLGRHYRGALDANSLPADDGREQYIILNTKPAPTSGHWVAFYRPGGARGALHYYDSYSEPLSRYFPAWRTRAAQADVRDREQRSRGLGDNVEDYNCGLLALTWLVLVKRRGIANAMLV